MPFRTDHTAHNQEPDMGEKKKEKPAPKPDTKADKKTSETVNLSAEDLRKISGGAIATPPGGNRPKTNTSS
jgi:hypothetical protein